MRVTGDSCWNAFGVWESSFEWDRRRRLLFLGALSCSLNVYPFARHFCIAFIRQFCFPSWGSISHEHNGCHCQRGRKLHCVLNLCEILQDSRLVFLFLEAKRGLYESYCIAEKQNNSVLFCYISWALVSMWYSVSLLLMGCILKYIIV